MENTKTDKIADWVLKAYTVGFVIHLVYFINTIGTFWNMLIIVPMSVLLAAFWPFYWIWALAFGRPPIDAMMPLYVLVRSFF